MKEVNLLFKCSGSLAKLGFTYWINKLNEATYVPRNQGNGPQTLTNLLKNKIF